MDQATHGAFLRRTNIGDILERGARRQRDKIAVVMGERRMTYHELNAYTNQMAHALRAIGVRPAGRIGVYGRNSIEFLALYFAAAKLGAVLCPANPALPSSELQYLMTHAEVSYAFCDPEFLPGIAAVSNRVPTVRGVYSLGHGADPVHESFLTHASQQPEAQIVEQVGDHDLAMIMYTSGTTSSPKGAMLSHINVTIGALHNAFAGEMSENTVATAILPLFHCGQLSITTGTLLRGGTVVIMDGFDATRLLALIQQEKITWMFGLPAMYRALLSHPMLDTADLSSLTFCLYAMAPMDQETLGAISRLGVRFALTSGQTEAYPPTVVFSPEFQISKRGTYWGKALPMTDMALMDDEGHFVPEGEVGEIVYRGPMVMLGYLKDPEATEHAFEHGWFHSGDLARFDDDGFLVFVDRKKDVVKSGGENVSSVKVESCLLEHPGVAAVAIVGIPHVRWGEAVVAAVLRRHDSTVSEAELVAHCKSRLAGFEVPKHFSFLDALPTTTTGKLQKFKLRQQLANVFAQPDAQTKQAPPDAR